MYKVKATGNYNIILKDIGVYFSYPAEVVITEEQYNKSKDLRILLSSGYVDISKFSNQKNTTNSVVEKSNQNQIFVTEGNSYFVDTNSFVKKEEEESKTLIQEVKHLNVESDVQIINEQTQQEVAQEENLDLKVDVDGSENLDEQTNSNIVEDLSDSFVDDIDSSKKQEEKQEEESTTKKNNFGKKKFGKK